MAIYMWCNGACWKFQKLCCHSGYCHWNHMGWPWEYDIRGRVKYPWGLSSLMEATKHPWCFYTVDERPGAWMEKVCPVLMRGSPTYPLSGWSMSTFANASFSLGSLLTRLENIIREKIISYHSSFLRPKLNFQAEFSIIQRLVLLWSDIMKGKKGFYFNLIFILYSYSFIEDI